MCRKYFFNELDGLLFLYSCSIFSVKKKKTIGVGMKKKAIILVNTDIDRSGEVSSYSCDSRYIECISEAGGAALLLPCTGDNDILARCVGIADGMLFIGGRDYPEKYYAGKVSPELKTMDISRSNSDIFLAQSVLNTRMPVLGICAGAQLISIVSGGSLLCHINNSRAHTGNTLHNVNITEGTLLKRILKGKRVIEIVSSHHQAVSPDAPGDNIRISALAEDGTVEAVETSGEGRFLLGLQWHPERSMDRTDAMKIFKAFISAALEYAGRKC